MKTDIWKAAKLLLAQLLKLDINEQLSLEVDYLKAENQLLTVSGLPETAPDNECTVVKIECEGPPAIYNCGGMRIPNVQHPRYDPCPSDIAW